MGSAAQRLAATRERDVEADRHVERDGVPPSARARRWLYLNVEDDVLGSEFSEVHICDVVEAEPHEWAGKCGQGVGGRPRIGPRNLTFKRQCHMSSGQTLSGDGNDLRVMKGGPLAVAKANRIGTVGDRIQWVSHRICLSCHERKSTPCRDEGERGCRLVAIGIWGGVWVFAGRSRLAAQGLQHSALFASFVQHRGTTRKRRTQRATEKAIIAESSSNPHQRTLPEMRRVRTRRVTRLLESNGEGQTLAVHRLSGPLTSAPYSLSSLWPSVSSVPLC
jgi:hypothetical protein